jgi:large subunit ribosomal protein L10
LLSADQLNSIASLPNKDEAISMLLGLILAPITNLALISKEIPSSMVRTLSAYSDSKN